MAQKNLISKSLDHEDSPLILRVSEKKGDKINAQAKVISHLFLWLEIVKVIFSLNFFFLRRDLLLNDE